MTADTPSDNTTTANDVGEWEEFREQLLSDPEVRDEYERTFHATVAFRKILQIIEAERGKAGLSKAELAQLIGVNPASLRRLLTAEGSNPTLKTMLAILVAQAADTLVIRVAECGTHRF